MNELNKNAWIIKANDVIDDVLSKAFKNAQYGSWDENQITTNVLVSLNKLGNVLKWKSQNQITVWDSYKQRGKAETESGDILFFIKVILSSKVTIEGVAYYEAKKMHLKNNLIPDGYTSFKEDQLVRICKHSMASNVLLYDVNLDSSTSEGAPTCSLGAFALPTIFACFLLKKGNKLTQQETKELPGFGKPWVYFLADNFSGFGLDYHPRAVIYAKNFIQRFHRDFPGNIVIATTSKVLDIEPELDRSFIPSDLYIPSNSVIDRENNDHMDN